MRGKPLGNLVKHIDRAVVDSARRLQQWRAALLGQPAPQRQRTLGEWNVRRILVSEPKDARRSVRAATVVPRFELLYQRNALAAHGESSRRRRTHRPAADNDDVVAANRLLMALKHHQQAIACEDPDRCRRDGISHILPRCRFCIVAWCRTRPPSSLRTAWTALTSSS